VKKKEKKKRKGRKERRKERRKAEKIKAASLKIKAWQTHDDIMS